MMILETLPLLDLIRLNLTTTSSSNNRGDGSSSSTGDALYGLSRSETAKVDWLERINDGEEEDIFVDTNVLSLPASSSSSFAICHLASIVSLTLGQSYPSITGYEEQVAVALAAHHLNTGNGSIVPEVQDLDKRCDIRFTTEMMDNQLDGSIAVTNALSFLQRPPQNTAQRRPCAFIGARASALTLPTAMLTSIQDYVQISASASSTDLDDPNLYPLFARTIPSDNGASEAFIQLLKQWNVHHLVVINVNDAFGNQLAEGLRLAMERYAPNDMVMQQIPIDQEAASSSTIPIAVQALKRTQFRYIYVAIHNHDNNGHDKLLLEAFQQGVAGNGIHHWSFRPRFPMFCNNDILSRDPTWLEPIKVLDKSLSRPLSPQHPRSRRRHPAMYFSNRSLNWTIPMMLTM